jgi:hypothetical protein
MIIFIENYKNQSQSHLLYNFGHLLYLFLVALVLLSYYSHLILGLFHFAVIFLVVFFNLFL